MGDSENPDLERAVVLALWKEWTERTLESQITGGIDDGAFTEADDGWRDGRFAGYCLAKLTASRLYASELSLTPAPIEDAIRRGIRFLMSRQRADGQLDLGGSYSPNEAGFVLPGLVEGYRRLIELPQNPLLDACAHIETFLRRGAEAVLLGSAYTANHRWTAACAPLAAVHSLWPDPRYLAKIEDYLADGIDIDSDGCWYEERSPNYNMVANAGLLMMADYLQRPELKKYVVRNFEFILHLIQPNNEIDSSFSFRQDRAGANLPPVWYGIARRVAIETGDGRYAALADLAWRHQDAALACLTPLLYDLESVPGPMPAAIPLPANYTRHFVDSSLVRQRSDNLALTLSADPGGHHFDTVLDQWGGARRSEDWLHLHAGDIVVQSLRLAGASMRNVQMSSIKKTEFGTFLLESEMDGWEHTLLFRPDHPKVDMHWGWKSSADVNIDKDSVRVHLESRSEISLAASLVFWIRPGVILTEGDGTPHLLVAGEVVPLFGGQPITLQSASSKLEILGLPEAAHQRLFTPPQSIPSSVQTANAAVFLGLIFPMDVALMMSYSRLDKG